MSFLRVSYVAGKFPNPPAPGEPAGRRVKVVPIVNAERRYDAEKGTKVYVQTPNARFAEDVAAAFPDAAAAKIIVACSDGRARGGGGGRWCKLDPAT